MTASPGEPGMSNALAKGQWKAILRLSLFFLLPVAELLILSVRIDTETLVGKTAWWARPLGHAGQIASIGLAMAASIILVVWSQGTKLFRAFFAPLLYRQSPWNYLVMHLLAMAAFCELTVVLVEGKATSTAYGNLILVAWATLGVLAGMFWILTIGPGSLWTGLLRQEWAWALLALAIGGVGWGVGQITDEFWAPLRRPTFWAAQGILRVIGQQTVCHPEIWVLGTRSFVVNIAPSCSGQEGIGLLWVFLGAYIWLFRKKMQFPQSLLLIPMGTVFVWLFNVCRIAALILIGSMGAKDFALGSFHSQAGWLSFLAVSLGLVAMSRHLSFFSREETAAENACGEGPSAATTAAYLGPLLALVAVTMVTKASVVGFDWVYPSRVLATVLAIWYFWRKMPLRQALKGAWSNGAVIIGGLVFVLWMTLEYIMPTTGSERAAATGKDIANGLAGLSPAWAFVWLGFRAFGSAITVPIAEELAFRGFLFRRFISHDFENAALRIVNFKWAVAFIVTSALFGGMHHRWLAGTLAGMLYAYALCRRGRVAHAVLAHATTNAMITAYVFATGNWALWT